MWMNQMDNKQMHQHQEEEEVDDEELGVAETYADYMPSKLKLGKTLTSFVVTFINIYIFTAGKKHPDPVVETASLSSVAPVDVWYSVSIPEDTIKTGALSALQLESITYTSQAHEHILPDGSRAGFLIGNLSALKSIFAFFRQLLKSLIWFETRLIMLNKNDFEAQGPASFKFCVTGSISFKQLFIYLFIPIPSLGFFRR